MAYRLEDKYTEPQIIAWVERQHVYSQWWAMWLGGIGVGLLIGLALGFLL